MDECCPDSKSAISNRDLIPPLLGPLLTWNPSGDIPRSDRSQPQFSSSPEEQDLVTACATPAEEMACTKLASLVPGDTTGYGPTTSFQSVPSRVFLMFPLISATFGGFPLLFNLFLLMSVLVTFLSAPGLGIGMSDICVSRFLRAENIERIFSFVSQS